MVPPVYRLWCRAREAFGFGTDAYDEAAAHKEFNRLMVEYGYEARELRF